MRTRVVLAAILTATTFTACWSRTNATSRDNQEKSFEKLFEISATDIPEIRYGDRYRRGFLDGFYIQWVRVSYTKELFDKIKNTRDFTAAQVSPDEIPSAGAPNWWRTPVARFNAFESDNSADSSAHGFRIREFLWHLDGDDSIYFVRHSWD